MMPTLPQLCTILAESLCLTPAHVTRRAQALQRAGLLPEGEVALADAVRLVLGLAADTAAEAPEVARRYAALTLRVIGSVELTACGTEHSYFNLDEASPSRRNLLDTLKAAVAGYANSTEAHGPNFTCRDLFLGIRPDGKPTAALDGSALGLDGMPTCHLEFLFGAPAPTDAADLSGPRPLQRTTVVPATILPILARLFPSAEATAGDAAGGLDLLDMMGLDTEAAAHAIPVAMEL